MPSYVDKAPLSDGGLKCNRPTASGDDDTVLSPMKRARHNVAASLHIADSFSKILENSGPIQHVQKAPHTDYEASTLIRLHFVVL